jgi:hypothetical protein
VDDDRVCVSADGSGSVRRSVIVRYERVIEFA